MERRKYTRLFPPLEFKFTLRSSKGEQYQVIIENISIGGIRFKTDKPISKGEIIEGDLFCPHFSISVVGHVVWVKGLGFSDGKHWNRVAVEFSKTREENTKILLESLIRYISGKA